MIYLLENPEGDQHALARRLLYCGLKREYRIGGEPAISKAPLGKPFLEEYPGIHFNYSHCRYGILCGISSMEIGVDIERRIPWKGSLARRICHPGELELLSRAEDPEKMLTAIWTAKESYLKYLGTGIRRDLREIDLSGAVAHGEQVDGCRLHLRMEGNYGYCVCTPEEEIEVVRVVKDPAADSGTFNLCVSR